MCRTDKLGCSFTWVQVGLLHKISDMLVHPRVSGLEAGSCARFISVVGGQKSTVGTLLSPETTPAERPK